ncbi:MAG: DUF2842 domain-containing protein [Alphaproteobacteria bacterium]|nr:DUF2842 domain-containing protein [Alphaproteobacteria bacterium]
MTARQRKFVGVLALLALIAVYAMLAVSLGDMLLPEGLFWLHLIYYAVTGLLWAVPAGLLIRWMQRPDEKL